MPAASQPNERWSIDFVTDCVSGGKVIRMLTIVDDCTRECPAIRGGHVGWVVSECDECWIGSPATEDCRKPLSWTTGRSFAGGRWPPGAKNAGVRLEFAQPGKPLQNAYVESFDGRLRDECLKANWFTNLSDARRKVEAWRFDYNQQLPHSSLDYLPPAECARKAAEIRA